MIWDPEKPYNKLPFLPPKAQFETTEVLKQTISAREALAAFNARANSLPNPTILINAIPVLEAQASSEIENIVTTTDELFSASVNETNATPAAREALRYRTALYAGWEQLGSKPLTSNTAIQVCNALRGHDEGVRRGEVIIANPATKQRRYTPPVGLDVLNPLLDNWSTFINDKEGIEPLARMAAAHYQFEAIHPFTDGNGRTGRIMNVLMLCDAGLLKYPLLYLSRYIIDNKNEYYKLLLAVTADDAWEPWVKYIIKGVQSTAEYSLRIVDAIEQAQERLVELIRSSMPVVNHDLVSVLMEQPYCRSRDVMERCRVSKGTAVKWLKTLVDAGILREQKIGRDIVYINLRLMQVLEGAATNETHGTFLV